MAGSCPEVGAGLSPAQGELGAGPRSPLTHLPVARMAHSARPPREDGFPKAPLSSTQGARCGQTYCPPDLPPTSANNRVIVFCTSSRRIVNSPRGAGGSPHFTGEEMEGPRNKTSPSQEKAERWGWFLMPWASPPPPWLLTPLLSLWGPLPPCVFPGAFTSATWKSTEGTWVTLELVLCDLCPVCSGPFGAPVSSAVNQGQKKVLLGLLKGRLRAR